MTDRGGYDGVFYAFVLALDRHSQTRSGMGLSVLIGGAGGYADDRINAAVVPLGYGFAAFLPSMDALGRGGRFGTRRGCKDAQS